MQEHHTKFAKKQHELFMLIQDLKKLQNQQKFLIENSYRLLQKTVIEKDFLHSCQINGEWYQFFDTMPSISVEYISKELESDPAYDFSKIKFKQGDIVIDIGANIGMVSIILAKKFPNIKIFAFEPIPRLYNCLVKNIEFHSLQNNIFPFNAAVSNESKETSMKASFVDPGGCTMFSDKEMGTSRIDMIYNDIKTVTLDEIFEINNINNCKLLKIDCEGAEYDILYGTKKLKNIEYITGEIHSFNVESIEEKHTPHQLMNYLKTHFKKEENLFLNIQKKVIPWL